MHLVTSGRAPAGHYTPVVVSNGFAFVSGQLPVEPETGVPMADFSIEEQTRQAMANVAGLLAAVGLTLAHAVSVTVYLTDVDLWGRFNDAYADAMGAHRPARTVVPVPALHHGVAVEVSVVADATTARLPDAHAGDEAGSNPSGAGGDAGVDDEAAGG